MLEKIFDRSFSAVLVIMFFVCATIYNIGYFGTLGESIQSFFYIPISIFDVIKSGFAMMIPLILILVIFKPILINPAFKGSFPGATILLIMGATVLISNFLYFAIFSDSPNQTLALLFEITFYISALVCFISIIYYFCTSSSAQSLLVIFFMSVILISFLIGVIDAKISLRASKGDNRSQILLTNDKVINANILRSFDKGILVTMNNISVDFIAWTEIKGAKFKKAI